MNCGVVEGVKGSTITWFGHWERLGQDGVTKRIDKSGVNAVAVKGRPPVTWKDSAGILEGEGKPENERRGQCKSGMFGLKQMKTLMSRPPPWGSSREQVLEETSYIGISRVMEVMLD